MVEALLLGIAALLWVGVAALYGFLFVRLRSAWKATEDAGEQVLDELAADRRHSLYALQQLHETIQDVVMFEEGSADEVMSVGASIHAAETVDDLETAVLEGHRELSGLPFEEESYRSLSGSEDLLEAVERAEAELYVLAHDVGRYRKVVDRAVSLRSGRFARLATSGGDAPEFERGELTDDEPDLEPEPRRDDRRVAAD